MFQYFVSYYVYQRIWKQHLFSIFTVQKKLSSTSLNYQYLIQRSYQKISKSVSLKKLKNQTFLELHNYKYCPYSNEYSTKNIPFVGKNLHLSFFQLQIGKKSKYHAAHLSVIGGKGILANLTKVQMPKLFDYKGKKHPCTASLA